jgi:hypothetical protein
MESDPLKELYSDLLEGDYDCVDRFVLNAYSPFGVRPGGFRHWWRLLHGSDEGLDNTHLMRMAGRFSRRLHGWAKANRIPVVDCARDEKKFEIAEKHLARHAGQPGVFLVLVGRAPALVWEVEQTRSGKIGNIKAKKNCFVNHYHFHIMDPDWGHMIIKMSGHPPFGAQIILNGHEYVARQAQREKLDFKKEGNCFVAAGDAVSLAKIADTLSEELTVGRLRQTCDRWIYSACLLFGLDLEEQQRSRFQYEYKTYQLEFSRNLRFKQGEQMEQVMEGLIDRSRRLLRFKQVKTIFGARYRPRRGGKPGKKDTTRWGVEVEAPTYDVTVLKVHYGKLSLKVYSKGERVLRIEGMVHNTRALSPGRKLERFPQQMVLLKEIVERFVQVLCCLDRCFIADDLLERLPTHSVVGASRVGGVDLNQARMRRVIGTVVSLALKLEGLTASQLASEVRAQNGQSEAEYGPRQAAYDLKKLRGKGLVQRKGVSRRYESTAEGLRTMAACIVLREKVIRPLLAGSLQLNVKRGRPAKTDSRIDRHYRALQQGMQELFAELGIAA